MSKKMGVLGPNRAKAAVDTVTQLLPGMIRDLALCRDVMELSGVRAAVHDMTPRGCPHVGKWLMLDDNDNPTDLATCLQQLRDPDVLAGIALGVVSACPLNFWSPGDLLGACCRALIGGVVFRSMSKLALCARVTAVAPKPSGQLQSVDVPETEQADDTDEAPSIYTDVPGTPVPRSPVGATRKRK